MTMDGSGSDNPAPRPVGHEAAHELDGESEAVEISAGADGISLEELVAQLEHDPGECRRACEGLESVDVETRISIIQGLAGISTGTGVIRLLELLATSESAETREAALAGLKNLDGGEDRVLRDSSVAAERWDDPGAGHAQGVLELALDSSREIVLVGDPDRPRLVNCLVTAVDGMGRGSVAISATRQTERCTAMFLCDVERGITDAIGQIEAESQGAGALLEVAKARAGGLGIEGIPELALRLLAGSLSLSGPATARPVMEWLERTLGRGLEPRPLPAPTAECSLEPGKLGSAPPRRPSSPGVSDVAGPIAADLRAGRGSQLAGRSRGRRPAPRFRRLPVPLRAPDHPPAGALSPDAALDALVLALCRGAGARRVCANPGVAALGRAVCRAVSSLHGGAHGPQPGRSSRATGNRG